MARFLGFAVLAFIVAVVGLAEAGEKAKDFEVKGTFTKDDPKDQQRKGASQVHAVTLKAGKVYTILMVSAEFDSFLRLLDPKGNQLDEDDDSGGGLNAQIVFNCTKDGDYKVVATTFGEGAYGNYSLTVKTTGGVQPPATAHSQMIGKPAPDLKADSVINGKQVKLADFKNKVVLLYFFDVRSSSCSALLKNLNEWDAAHKKDGLAVVGVTYYPSEIGQRIGWDKENGKVTTVKKSDAKSDQAVFAAYASHHKATHPLLALGKADALSVYDTYVVNGVPQVVLIDRKGVVRFIDINGEKNATAVEAEIKKLIAEK